MTSVVGQRVALESLGRLIQIGSGGQGRIYAVDQAVLGWPAESVVLKRYGIAKVRPNFAVLETLIGYGGRLATGEVDLMPRLAWPLAVVTEDRRDIGFLMPRIPRRFELPMVLPGGTQTTACQAQHLLNDEEVLANRGIPQHDRMRLELLRDLAETMCGLHSHGLTVGDFSPMNIFLSVQNAPRCFLIDCDAVCHSSGSVLPQVETMMWEAPTGEPRATPMSDAYKFALFVIRLFAGDQDAVDPGPIGRTSANLAGLAQRGTERDPTRRPSIGDWIPALTAAIPMASRELPRARRAQARTGGPAIVTPAAPPRPGQRVPPTAPPMRPMVPANQRRPLRTALIVGLVAITLCFGVAATLGALL